MEKIFEDIVNIDLNSQKLEKDLEEKNSKLKGELLQKKKELSDYFKKSVSEKKKQYEEFTLNQEKNLDKDVDIYRQRTIDYENNYKSKKEAILDQIAEMLLKAEL